MPSEDLKHDLDVPGTTVLLDTSAEAGGSDNFTLVPTPSSSLEDPLNWSKARKWLQLACIVAYVLSADLNAGCLYAIYGPLSEATGLTLDNINSGTGFVYLGLGIGALFTVPLALAIGKRPIYIFSISLSCIYPFVLPHVNKYSAWVGLCFANGFIMSPLFVLPEVSIADMLFYHERALPMGIYVATTYGGAVFAPIVSGYIYDRLGWHGPPYLCGGLNAIVAIFLFIFLEETNFVRHIPHETHVAGAATSAYDSEKGIEKSETVVDVVETEVYVRAHDRITSTWPGPRPWRMFKISQYAGGIIIRGLLQPIAMLCQPITLFCGLLFGIYQIFFNCMAAMSSGVLSAPPYNLAPNSIGLTFISPFLAIVPGALMAGWACDRWTIRCARRNGGVSEPEDKLKLMIVPTCLTPIGLLMMSLGVYYEVHWMVFVAGEFVLTVAGPMATLLSLTYAFDSFHSLHPRETDGPRAEVQQAGPYVLSLMLFGMCMTFGFNYAITDWAFVWGFKNFAWSSVLVATVINCSAFVMIKFGKRLRKSGAGLYSRIINM